MSRAALNKAKGKTLAAEAEYRLERAAAIDMAAAAAEAIDEVEIAAKWRNDARVEVAAAARLSAEARALGHFGNGERNDQVRPALRDVVGQPGTGASGDRVGQSGDQAQAERSV